MKTSAKSRFVRSLVVSVVASGTLLGLSDAAGAVPVPWKNCGAAGDTISISAFDASVWPPQAGRPVTFRLRGNVGRSINPGAHALVRLTLTSGRQVQGQMLFAPIPAGPYDQTIPFTLPRLFPPGSLYKIHFEAYNSDETRLTCMDVTIPIK